MKIFTLILVNKILKRWKKINNLAKHKNHIRIIKIFIKEEQIDLNILKMYFSNSS